MNNENFKAEDVIAAFGGGVKVAKLCDISRSAVHQWKRNGIPKAQLNFLKATRPSVFKKIAASPAPGPESPP